MCLKSIYHLQEFLVIVTHLVEKRGRKFINSLVKYPERVISRYDTKKESLYNYSLARKRIQLVPCARKTSSRITIYLFIFCGSIP